MKQMDLNDIIDYLVEHTKAPTTKYLGNNLYAEDNMITNSRGVELFNSTVKEMLIGTNNREGSSDGGAAEDCKSVTQKHREFESLPSH